MPVLRLILPRAAVAGVAALLLGVPALAAQASASPAAASPGAVIQVAGAGAPAAVGDHAPGRTASPPWPLRNRWPPISRLART